MELTTVPIDKPDDVNFIPLRKRERQRVAVCRDDRAGTAFTGFLTAAAGPEAQSDRSPREQASIENGEAREAKSVLDKCRPCPHPGECG